MSSYVNMAMWDSFASFKSAISKYIRKPGEKKRDFEVERYRAVLEPVAWRIGDFNLPQHDSAQTS